ncbi:MAG: hypothetical protein U0930_11995 [Pirellulales bacterium]
MATIIEAAFRTNRFAPSFLVLPHDSQALIRGKAAEKLDFPVLVPREYAARMTKGDPNDPHSTQIIAGVMEVSASIHGLWTPL